MQDQSPWSITVIRANGLRLMRPEKWWRPIITIEVDKHHFYETVFGIDGQNPNLKDLFWVPHVDAHSHVDIKIWHRSQSKKKGKKRKLVAMASHTLGELLRKQEMEPHSKLDVRLNCFLASKKSVASRGKAQNGASVQLKLCPPPDVPRPLVLEGSSGDQNWESGFSSCICAGSTPLSVTKASVIASESDSVSPIDLPSPTVSVHEECDTVTTGLRRRRIRGYAIDSGDEIYSTDDDAGLQDRKPFADEFLTGPFKDDDPFCDSNTVIQSFSSSAITITQQESWIAASLLPRYTEKVEVPPSLNRLERLLSSFTVYSELKSATLDSHYEAVFTRLQTEWMSIGGMLVALAAVNAAVFAMSSDAIFSVDSYARKAIAASSIASGIGIACDAWFLFRYNWASLHTFIDRARDLYGSYFFFTLSARVPALCMVASAISLMGFLGLVAFEVWPIGVLVTCFAIGLIMTMQFLVYGVHWCASKVVEGGRASTRGVVLIARKMTRST